MEFQQQGVKIIETAELESLLETSPDTVKLVCATWYLGSGAPNPIEEFAEGHIPNSVYFSITEIADKSTGMMATLPSQEDFIKEMKRLGIRKTQTVVVYEHEKIFAGPRAAWMLRTYGHLDVRILNGCFKKWKSEDRKTETGEPQDVNDSSDEGYDYVKDDNLIEDLHSTVKKIHAVKRKTK